MPFTTYQELQDGVAAFLDRDDLTATIPDFIRLAELRIQRSQRWYRHTYSIANSGAAFSVTEQPMALPSYVRELVALWQMDGTTLRPIDIITPEAWRTYVNGNGNATGTPRKATVLSYRGERLVPI